MLCVKAIRYAERIQNCKVVWNSFHCYTSVPLFVMGVVLIVLLPAQYKELFLG